MLITDLFMSMNHMITRMGKGSLEVSDHCFDFNALNLTFFSRC